jgi:hypothetical protein
MATGEFIDAIGDQQEEGQVGEGTGEEAEEIEGGGVRPVEVIEQQEERMLCGEGSEEVAGVVEEGSLAGDRTDGAALGEGGRKDGRVVYGRVGGEEIDPGTVGRGLGKVVAASDQHQRALLSCLPRQCLGERGLADPRLPTDQNEAAVPCEGGIEVLAQEGEFARTPNKRGWNAGK